MVHEQQESGRSERNRTMVLTASEQKTLVSRCKSLKIGERVDETSILRGGAHESHVFLMDAFDFLPAIADACVDLVLFDPPYNLRKSFHGWHFKPKEHDDYLEWIGRWLVQLSRILKPGGSIYVCSDWRSSASVQIALGSLLDIRNRITWEREKGRGSLDNWKNASEDIWYATKGDSFYFDTVRTKLRRRVKAPYRDRSGKAKDWFEAGQAAITTRTDSGAAADASGESALEGKFRDTFPSNIWTDLTVPFWSMPENTDHPTQKPEKLAAKLILASCPADGVVFDPCSGSGSFLSTAAKLGRRCFGVEQNPYYAALCRKRLDDAAHNRRIQGYEGGVFFERNSVPEG